MPGAKLSQLVRSEPQNSNGIEVPCGLGCGNLVRDWVQFTAFPAGVTMEPLAGARGEEAKKPTIDLRVCHACFGIYLYDLTLVQKELMERVMRRG